MKVACSCVVGRKPEHETCACKIGAGLAPSLCNNAVCVVLFCA